MQSWSESPDDERISVNNGILLCKNHHALFDDGIIEFTKQYALRVRYRKKKSRVDDEYLSAMNDVPITLPKNKGHWPNLNYLVK